MTEHFYASVGPVLSWFDIDIDGGTLTRRGSVELPAPVQYAWPDRKRRVFYVCASDQRPLQQATGRHLLASFRIVASGALEPLGTWTPLRQRPLHLSVDGSGRFLLVAYNSSSAVTVHRIEPNGSIGPEQMQNARLDFGVYAHQVLTTPDNRFVLVPSRGETEKVDGRTAPGALKIFGFDDGALSAFRSYAPGDDLDYGARHLDIHPNARWAYLVLEKENRLQTFYLDPGTGLQGPVFEATTLRQPDHIIGWQMAGAVHVHPNGRFVYVSNRSFGDGGEDNIAAFAIDPHSGEPRLVQHRDGGIHMRTFCIDGSGQCLVAASTKPYTVMRDGRNVIRPASLSMFRIDADGGLVLVREHEVSTGSYEQFWCGIA